MASDKVSYTPTHFENKPAIFIFQSEGNAFSYLVYQDKEIVKRGCSDLKKILDHLDLKKISSAWKFQDRFLFNQRYKNEDNHMFISTTSMLPNIAILQQKQYKCEDFQTKSQCSHVSKLEELYDRNFVELLLKQVNFLSKDNLKINVAHPASKAIGLGVLLNKMIILIGPTGTGKTRTTQDVCIENGFDLFETTVGQDGNHRKALYGEKDIESNADGQLSILRAPGALIKAARNVRDNGNTTVLFVDEAFRSEGMDVFTFLSPREDPQGNLYYEFDGIDKQRFVYLESKGNVKLKTWALLTKDSSYRFQNGIPRDFIQKNTDFSVLENLAIDGRMPRITELDIEKYKFSITERGEIFSEKFRLSADSFFIVFAGNYGRNYQLAQSKLDDAVLSRSIIQEVSLTDYSPKELISIALGKTKKEFIDIRPITNDEKENLKQVMEPFFNGVLSMTQENNVKLPNKAYSLRNISTLLNITHMPTTSATAMKFINELLSGPLLYHYISHKMGLETIEPNAEQKEALIKLVKKTFDKNLKPSPNQNLHEMNLLSSGVSNDSVPIGVSSPSRIKL